MTAPTAILHIGVTKTGTSSIQARLEANRATLAAASVHLPASLGHRNHARLIDAARDPDGPDAAAFRAEMQALPPAIRTVVFTSEAFGAMLTTPAAVAPLRRLLDPCFAAFAVHVYLRRQDEHRVSSFSTAMRAGMGHRQIPLSGRRFADYGPLLEAWAAVFGRAAVHPRVFVRAEFPGGDVVADFCRAAGLPALPEPAEAGGDRNTSLVPAAQRMLDRLAEVVRATGDAPDLRSLPGRPWLLEQLDQRFAGPGLLPARDAAARMLDACRDANEAVRAAWFPERATLFPADLTRYPEQATPEPDADAVLEVALTLLAEALAMPRPTLHPARNGRGSGDITPTPDRASRRAARRQARAGR